MPNTTVYFATNRVAQGPTTDWRSYGSDIVLPTDPSLIIYAAAFVEGTDPGAEGSGGITAISHAESGAFHPGVSQDIFGSGKDIPTPATNITVAPLRSAPISPRPCSTTRTSPEV
jgi:hypothetical protein